MIGIQKAIAPLAPVMMWQAIRNLKIRRLDKVMALSDRKARSRREF